MLVIVLAFLVWSAIRPYSYDVWLFEIAIGFVGILILIFTRKWLRFSGLVYVLAGIHFAILAIGAKYTYAEMPLFGWLRDSLHLARNYYDRVGHLMQGFVPVLVVREILLRLSRFPKGAMLQFVSVCVVLALSAFYELIEWWVVIVFYPGAGTDWLGMQGDQWDAQQDMFICLIGAMLALVMLSRFHDRSMSKMEK